MKSPNLIGATIDDVEARPLDRELTDGVVSLRRPCEGDAELLVDGRDVAPSRFMGESTPGWTPTAVVLNGEGQIVGWIDYDVERTWLVDGEVNIGYTIFREHRRQGFARRSLDLLMSFLAEDSQCRTATLLIDPENAPSIALAERAGFARYEDVAGHLLYKRPAVAR